jgi:deoxycytidine triphosphate deaminase
MSFSGQFMVVERSIRVAKKKKKKKKEKKERREILNMAGTKLHSFVFYIIHSNEKLKLRRNVLVVQYLYNKTYW